MRLNLFLPAGGRTSGPTVTLRKLLGKLGESWAASPLRRLIQTASLVLFLVLLFFVCRPQGAPRYAEAMQAREFIEAETFLALDPLVSISASIAARAWVWSLAWAAVLLGVCLIFPRGFCGYVCPLGTLIDMFEWAIGRRTSPAPVRQGRWRVHLKYYLFAGILAAAAGGVTLSGFFAAIGVLTRGMQSLLEPLQLGILRGWDLVPPVSAAQIFSIALLLAVVSLSFLGRRFWCNYLCPSGAVFSIAAMLRLTRRKVTTSCTSCNKCVEICPFDAIRADFTTRNANCTFCQTCGGVCPTGAIQFVPRWDRTKAKPPNENVSKKPSLSRRSFLGGVASGLAVAFGIDKVFAARPGDSPPPIRPPGSVPEEKFPAMCVRCGSCLKACSTNTLQPQGFSQGIEGLWTPRAVANWAGCAPECNVCGQVCPTGAIRALPLAEKRAARMGLAVVNRKTCLPRAGRGPCRMCVDTCKAAGYNAIEFIRVGVEMDPDDLPIPDSGYLAPVVLSDKCVGCGLCQNRCYRINVLEKGLLADPAVHVEAGKEKEDRIMRGSYRALREARDRRTQRSPDKTPDDGGDYLPDFLR